MLLVCRWSLGGNQTKGKLRIVARLFRINNYEMKFVNNDFFLARYTLCMGTKFLFTMMTLGLFLPFGLFAQKTMWVGESYKCDATSAVMGITSDVSWTTNGGYLSLSGSGFYRNVTVTQYFSGTATVECSWKYKLYSGDTWRRQSKSWIITCNENPVYISPASLTLAPGETAHVGYNHQYNNSYTSAANVRFSSTNSRIVTVSASGLVTAVSEGTAYINVYSTISNAANAPSCKVTVKKINPTSVSLPSSISLTVNARRLLLPIVLPAGASTSFTRKPEDSNIATVDDQGYVRGIRTGTTRIWVTTTVGGYTSCCSVTVKDPPPAPTNITVKTPITLYKGFGYTIVPVLQPDGAESIYEWSSDDASIASVSFTGKVTTKKEGTVTITVTTQNGLKATCEVIVLQPPVNINESMINNKIAVIENLINMTFDESY